MHRGGGFRKYPFSGNRREYITIDKTFYNFQNGIGNKDQLTFSLNASHFLFHGDCFDCTITMSVFVLLSPVDVEGVYCRCFFLLVVPFNSSFTISYPFFAKSATFASFNFWKANETFWEGRLDLSLLNKVSAVSLDAECWKFSSPDDALLPSLLSVPCLAEVPLNSEDSSFPIPKLSLT